MHTNDAPVTPARLVVTGDPESVRRMRVSAWVGLALSLGCVNLAFALGWLVTYSLVWPPVVPGVPGPTPGFRSAVMGCFLLWMALPVAAVTPFPALITDAWQMARIRIVIDHRGVSRADWRQVTVPWEHLRHVAVTTGSQRARRLVVDDGSAPASFWSRTTIGPGPAFRRLLSRRRPFLVNVPISRLDIHETDLIRAIHHYSAGRFPDHQVCWRSLLNPPHS